MRTTSWKLIEDHLPPGVQLYDLTTDPGETRNLAAEHPDIVERLEQALARWKELQKPLDVAHPASEVTLDAEEVEKLKALGYGGF